MNERGFRILNVFIENKGRILSVSDVMKKANVCWATASDYIFYAERLNIIERRQTSKKSGWVLSERFSSVV